MNISVTVIIKIDQEKIKISVKIKNSKYNEYFQILRWPNR